MVIMDIQVWMTSRPWVQMISRPWVVVVLVRLHRMAKPIWQFLSIARILMRHLNLLVILNLMAALKLLRLLTLVLFLLAVHTMRYIQCLVWEQMVNIHRFHILM